MRDALVDAAVQFLADPKTHAHPLNTRVSFLEEKGLTQPEIGEALKRAASSTIGGAVQESALLVSSSSSSPAGPSLRDYLAGVLVTAGLGYGLLQVVGVCGDATHLHRWLPTNDTVQEERDRLEQQLVDAAATLEVVKSESATGRDILEKHGASLADAIDVVNGCAQSVRDAAAKRDEEVKQLREEVAAMKELLPKLLDKVKQSQCMATDNIQTELKSLKSLLVKPAMDASGGSGSPATFQGNGMTTVTAPPLLPAWQLQETAVTKRGEDDAGVTEELQ